MFRDVLEEVNLKIGQIKTMRAIKSYNKLIQTFFDGYNF